MGIRFHCHSCNEPLHVKFFQAGKRGRCPKCNNRFRIPNEDSEFSIPLDPSDGEAAVATLDPRNTAPQASPPQASGPQASALQASAPQADEMPASLAAVGDARWFVRPPSGGVYGPADTRTLTSWISQRRVTCDSYVWREGMENWRIAIELMPDAFPTELAGVASAAAPPVALPDKNTMAVPATLPATLPAELAEAPRVKARANLEQRRRKKQKQTWIILGLLIAIVMGLIATLFVVLRG